MLFWDSLYSCTGTNLYETILSVFAERCFTPSVVEALRPHLLTVLPIYHKHMYETPLTQKTVKYIHEEAFKTGVKKGKPDSEETLIFEAGFLVLLHFNPTVRSKLVADFESFLGMYPEFRNNDDVNEREMMRLLLFHNMMEVALSIIPAKFKKTHLLDLVCRVSEGNQKKYVCGGGQSANVDRRVLIYERTGGICKQKRAPRWNEIIASLSTATMPGSTPKASGSANGTRKLSGGTDGPTENAKMRKINPVCTFSESISLPEHGNMQVNTNEVKMESDLTVRASSIMQEQPQAQAERGDSAMDVGEGSSLVNATASHGSSGGGGHGFVEVMQHFMISDLSGQLLPSLAGGAFPARGASAEEAEEAEMKALLSSFEPDSGSFCLGGAEASTALLSPLPSGETGVAAARPTASAPVGSPNARMEMMQSSHQQYNSDKDVMELLIESGVLHEDDNVILSSNAELGVNIPVSAANSEAVGLGGGEEVCVVEYNDTSISISKKKSVLYLQQRATDSMSDTAHLGLGLDCPADGELDEFGIPLAANSRAVDEQFMSPLSVAGGTRFVDEDSQPQATPSQILIRHPTIQNLMGGGGGSANSSFYGAPGTSALALAGGVGPSLTRVATAATIIEEDEARELRRPLLSTHNSRLATPGDVIADADADAGSKPSVSSRSQPESDRLVSLTYNSLAQQLSNKQQSRLPPLRGGSSSASSNNSTMYQPRTGPPALLMKQDSLGSDFGALLDDISQDIFVGMDDDAGGSSASAQLSSLLPFGDD